MEMGVMIVIRVKESKLSYMRHCRPSRISLALPLGLSLETTSLRLEIVNVGRKSVQLSLQSSTMSRKSVVPVKEAGSHCMDGTDSPKKTKSIVESRQLGSSDEAEAKKVRVHEIALVENSALLRCKHEACGQTSAKRIVGPGDSSEVAHNNIGFRLVQDGIGL
jgi:hypothetical protein